MIKDDLVNEYFEWMYSLVVNDRYFKHLSYRKLLYFLHDVDFTYSIPLDGNRESDGINLRYRFGSEHGYDDSMIASYLDDRPCSVFEMMVALSIRCEETIMDDPQIGNRTGQWFWNMIVSMGLGHMSNDNFNPLEAGHIVNRFLTRNYKRNGEGGLFTLDNCPFDMRSTEIWNQMCWYLDETLKD